MLPLVGKRSLPTLASLLRKPCCLLQTEEIPVHPQIAAACRTITSTYRDRMACLIRWINYWEERAHAAESALTRRSHSQVDAAAQTGLGFLSDDEWSDMEVGSLLEQGCPAGREPPAIRAPCPDHQAGCCGSRADTQLQGSLPSGKRKHEETKII